MGSKCTEQSTLAERNTPSHGVKPFRTLKSCRTAALTWAALIFSKNPSFTGRFASLLSEALDKHSVSSFQLWKPGCRFGLLEIGIPNSAPQPLSFQNAAEGQRTYFAKFILYFNICISRPKNLYCVLAVYANKSSYWWSSAISDSVSTTKMSWYKTRTAKVEERE